MMSRSLLVCFVVASIASVGIWILSELETNTKVMLIALTYWFALVVLMTFNAPYLISRIYSSIDIDKSMKEARDGIKNEANKAMLHRVFSAEQKMAEDKEKAEKAEEEAATKEAREAQDKLMRNWENAEKSEVIFTAPLLSTRLRNR